MTQSRAEKLGQMHECDTCKVLHYYIPAMHMMSSDSEGNWVQAPLLAMEIVVAADGPVRFTDSNEPLITARVPIVGLLWAQPGSKQYSSKSILVLN